jgi:4-hydroxymandelate synthase
MTADEHYGFDLDYTEIYVGNLDAALGTWCDQYGLEQVAVGGSPDTGFRSVVLRCGGTTLVLTEAISPNHRAARYVEAHGDGVADIALRTDNVTRAYEAIVAAGGSGLVEPRRVEQMWVAQVAGFGDVVHTLFQSGEGCAGIPPGYRAIGGTSAGRVNGYEVAGTDHFAVLVPPGCLDATIEFYRRALGFDEIYDERIVVGAQAMLSKVVQNASRTVTFTILAPDPNAAAGQIDDFLANHGGAGVQHVAFAVNDIAVAVSALAERGVEFLSTPDAYYERLPDRVPAPRHSVELLCELNILVDEDRGGQLFQIFTRSIHPRRTLFFEVIERHGASSFGSANIKALYEAVKDERVTFS